MKAVFKISKFSHQKQRYLSCLWPTVTVSCPCPLLTKIDSDSHHHSHTASNRKIVPSLIHLAVIRTLSVFKKETHYEILGVSPSATANEIRNAFLKLSKLSHPDLGSNNVADHQKFVLINEAYSVLSKPASRREYDASIRKITTSHSHIHSHYKESEYYYYNYNKGNSYEETDWTKQQKKQRSTNIFTNFYTVTASVTFAIVTIILYYLETIPSPRMRGLRNDLTTAELEHHDLIMVSEHDGMTVFYYAVPLASDPKVFEVLAVKRTQGKDSSTHELQELNNVDYSKPNI